MGKMKKIKLAMPGFQAFGIALMAILAATPVIADSHNPVSNFEGLTPVDSGRFDLAFLRPGTNFTPYKSVMLTAPELAFRTPDRSKREFPVKDEQRERLRTMLTTQFQNQISQIEDLDLVETPGPQVLRLRIRLQGIRTTVSATSVSNVGWLRAALDAAGEATLILELEDSESKEILARIVDERSVDGVAFMVKDGTAETRWEQAETLAEEWAKKARRGLEDLIEQ